MTSGRRIRWPARSKSAALAKRSSGRIHCPNGPCARVRCRSISWPRSVRNTALLPNRSSKPGLGSGRRRGHPNPPCRAAQARRQWAVGTSTSTSAKGRHDGSRYTVRARTGPLSTRNGISSAPKASAIWSSRVSRPRHHVMARLCAASSSSRWTSVSSSHPSSAAATARPVRRCPGDAEQRTVPLIARHGSWRFDRGAGQPIRGDRPRPADLIELSHRCRRPPGPNRARSGLR